MYAPHVSEPLNPAEGSAEPVREGTEPPIVYDALLAVMAHELSVVKL